MDKNSIINSSMSTPPAMPAQSSSSTDIASTGGVPTVRRHSISGQDLNQEIVLQSSLSNDDSVQVIGVYKPCSSATSTDSVTLTQLSTTSTNDVSTSERTIEYNNNNHGGEGSKKNMLILQSSSNDDSVQVVGAYRPTYATLKPEDDMINILSSNSSESAAEVLLVALSNKKMKKSNSGTIVPTKSTNHDQKTLQLCAQSPSFYSQAKESSHEETFVSIADTNLKAMLSSYIRSLEDFVEKYQLAKDSSAIYHL